MSASDSLFKVNQIARACSVSRATILRMEEDGLIKPSYKDPSSGYRYYSVDDLMQIRQILSLRGAGFSSKLIQKYLAVPSDFSPLIAELEERILFMSNTLKIFRQESALSGSMSVNHLIAPMMYYYENVKEFAGGLEEIEDFLQETVKEAIDEGLHLNIDGYPLILTDRTDLLHGSYQGGIKYTYRACVPVLEKTGKKIIPHPAGDVMYTLWNGDLSTLTAHTLRLVEAAAEEQLIMMNGIGFEPLVQPRQDPASNNENGSGERLIRIGVPVIPKTM